jgi:hypothetical protein
MFTSAEIKRVIESIDIISSNSFAYRLAQHSMELYIRDTLIMEFQSIAQNKDPNSLVIPEWKKYDMSTHNSYQYKMKDEPTMIMELKWSTAGYALMGKADFIDGQIGKDVTQLLAEPRMIPKYQIFFFRCPDHLPDKKYNEFILGYSHHKNGFSILDEYNKTNNSSLTINELLEEKVTSYYKGFHKDISVTNFQLKSGMTCETTWSIYVYIARIP